MAARIEDYALIGDTLSAALVARSGSIDWACFPRFDSGACFAALLGEREHGRWVIAPAGPVRAQRRRYREGTMVLETEWDTDEGSVRLTDFMPVRGRPPSIVRIVEGLRGRVRVDMELVIRFDYGSQVPWVRRCGEALLAISGPDALAFRGDIPMNGQDLATVGSCTVAPGQRRTMYATWYPSHEEQPPPIETEAALDETTRWWEGWTRQCRYGGRWREEVLRSLLVLKALIYEPTGAVIAAPTTSLPEWPGGVRNWDYRFCWLRDATQTLYALMLGGYRGEAEAWREWLLRAAAGSPAGLQTIYGAAGERRLREYEVPWLPGYERSRPVRVGNLAHQQFQLDVYGEVLDTLHETRRLGAPPDQWSWGLEKTLLDFLEGRWREPDEGIWEVRQSRRHFTHSKVMAWVGFDRAVRSVEALKMDGPVDRWRAVRDEIHADVCAHGFDRARNTFTQSYGDARLDAALLKIPLVGFLPPTDPRVLGTLAAIERELIHDGFMRRYHTEASGAVDGLPAGEGVFLPCSFWLVDTYAAVGRLADAEALFRRLLALANDVGLLSEEWDPAARRMLGNFPQAFTHVALVSSASALSGAGRAPP